MSLRLQQMDQPGAHRFRRTVVAADHENGVVARNRAQHLRPFLIVERHRDGTRVAGRGFQNHLILGLPDILYELARQRRKVQRGGFGAQFP